jgi:hypothetical protein
MCVVKYNNNSDKCCERNVLLIKCTNNVLSVDIE